MTIHFEPDPQGALPFSALSVMHMLEAIGFAFGKATRQKGGPGYKTPTFLEYLHSRGFTVVPIPGFVPADADAPPLAGLFAGTDAEQEAGEEQQPADGAEGA